MDWINEYQLFLFDFDGLLVNTEELHYLAYKKMCASQGFDLDWDFNRYCQAAHYHSEGLRDQIFERFPQLKGIDPTWKNLYAIKQESIINLINEGAVHLMPGAEKLLKLLEASNIKRCVVTHSPDELVNAIRCQNPILDTIPNWITRHDYSHPKPNPECYLKAIERYAHKDDKLIGFEDTPRGLAALMATKAQPVLISQVPYPEIPGYVAKGVWQYGSLDEMFASMH